MGSTHDIDVCIVPFFCFVMMTSALPLSLLDLLFPFAVLKDPPKRIDYVFVKSFDEDGGMIGPSSFVHCRPIGKGLLLEEERREAKPERGAEEKRRSEREGKEQEKGSRERERKEEDDELQSEKRRSGKGIEEEGEREEAREEQGERKEEARR